MSLHFDILNTFSMHPASPVLLTSKGPRKDPGHSTPCIPEGDSREESVIEERNIPEAERARMGRLSTARPLGADLLGSAPLEVPAILPYDFRSLKIG